MYKELSVSKKNLLGAGPSSVDPKVLRAMSTPLVGHLDPEFLVIMNETMDLLRYVFQTQNKLTMPMSGTGSSGMETVLVNFIEPGDDVIVGINGLFGMRMADIANRCGAKVHPIEAEWGKIIDPDLVKEKLNATDAKLVAIVHAETSTGVSQPLKEISNYCKEKEALLIADCVTSLGGMPVNIDEIGIDIAYSGTQKCLSCPPGLAPITVNDRALQKLRNRKTPVLSWYFDLSMLQNYWGKERFYHHTAPISMIYALREALKIVYEEGLEPRFKRHQLHSKALVSGLEAMGIEMLAQEGHRLPMLNAFKIPEGIDDAKLRRYLLEELGIEISGGLGTLKGKIGRIGLMGYSCDKSNVMAILNGLELAFMTQNHPVDEGKGIKAAEAVYRQSC